MSGVRFVVAYGKKIGSYSDHVMVNRNINMSDWPLGKMRFAYSHTDSCSRWTRLLYQIERSKVS